MGYLHRQGLGFQSRSMSVLIFALGVDALCRLLPQLFPDAPASDQLVTGVIASLLFASVVHEQRTPMWRSQQIGCRRDHALLGGVSRITREPRSPGWS